MKYKDLLKKIKLLKKKYKIKSNAECYIDVYECLCIDITDSQSLVIDINENNVFTRG